MVQTKLELPRSKFDPPQSKFDLPRNKPALDQSKLALPQTKFGLVRNKLGLPGSESTAGSSGADFSEIDFARAGAMRLEPCGWHERVELGTGWMGVVHELGEEPLEVAERIGVLGHRSEGTTASVLLSGGKSGGGWMGGGS